VGKQEGSVELGILGCGCYMLVVQVY